MPIAAEEITVAVASNFLVPMQEIVVAFETETGNTVNIAGGSSGRLYAQIRNGAPYHAFFSADQDKPAQWKPHSLIQPEHIHRHCYRHNPKRL